MRSYFLTDLDGTLLRSDAVVSKFTVQTLTSAMEQGMIISYATARSYMSSNKIVSAIPWRYPIILYNGAVLFDPVSKAVVGGRWLNLETTNQVIEMGRSNGLVPFLFALDEDDRERVLHEQLTRNGDLQFYASRPNDPRFGQQTRLSCPADYRTLIITYIGLWEELEPLRLALDAKFGEQVCIHMMRDNYIDQHYFLEVSHIEANKGDGLKQWARLMNCEPSEITVFGDNLNDAGMFELAGARSAVANSHARLLELASIVIGSNDEDAVASYIAKALEERVSV
jgi:Cof subfamily protein (haloacid dehalogenase superfamily)